MNLPNKLTMLRVCMIPLFLVAYLVKAIPNNYLWALIVFAVASLTDLLDGHIARSRGLVTDFGKLMDPLADKLLVMSAMLCFIQTGMVNVVIVIVILSREFLVTSIRLLAASGGSVLAADIWGKLKTVAQMSWICVVILSQWISAEFSEAYSYNSTITFVNLILSLIVLVLTVFSGANYVIKNRGLFKSM